MPKLWWRDRRPIPSLYRAEGEPGIGGLWRREAEARAAELEGLLRGGWNDLALPKHLDNELRAAGWVAFGHSEKLGKRVLINSPWRPHLRFDDLGQMWDGRDLYTDTLFYRVADHAELGVDTSASGAVGEALLAREEMAPQPAQPAPEPGDGTSLSLPDELPAPAQANDGGGTGDKKWAYGDKSRAVSDAITIYAKELAAMATQKERADFLAPKVGCSASLVKPILKNEWK